jgi:hypothetical protein
MAWSETFPFLNEIVERITGPLRFRFIVQPVIAVLLGMRDGRLDAKAGSPPYVLDLLIHPEHRGGLFSSAGGTLLTPVIVGTVLDAIAQYLIFESIRPLQAVVTGTVVMALPYAVSRGVVNRFITRKKRRG